MGGPWEDYQDTKAESGPWDDYAQAPVEAQPESDTVPEWGRENPNLYGAAGAIKETALTAGRAVKNLPGDVLRLGGETAKLLTTQTPVDVAMSLVKAATGGVGKLIPGEQPYEQDFDSLANIYKTKYGSLDNLKKTIEEKPAEFLADITTAMSGTGAALKGAGKVSGVKALETAGKATTEAGVKIGMAPVKAAEKGVKGVQVAGGKVAAAIPEDMPFISPERMYASATKMPLSKKWTQVLPGKEVSERRIATKAGLEQGIMPSEQGLAKITQLEKDVRSIVDSTIAEGAKKGDIVKTSDILKGLGKAYEKADNASDPILARRIVDNMAERFKAHGDTIPSDKLNAIKRQIYEETNYGAPAPRSLMAQIKETGKKGLAHEAKVQLEQLYPEIKGLNQKDASYIKLKEAIEKATGRIANKDIVDLGTTVAAAGGGGVWGALKFVVDNPTVKARLAIALYKMRQKGLKGRSGTGLKFTGAESAILSSSIAYQDKERFLENIYKKNKE